MMVAQSLYWISNRSRLLSSRTVDGSVFVGNKRVVCSSKVPDVFGGCRKNTEAEGLVEEENSSSSHSFLS